MPRQTASLLLFCALATLPTACKKDAIDKGEVKPAIDHYLAARHECVWPEPIKMPAQADTSKDEKTRDFDALTDAGLLIRAPEEKKRFLIGSKEVNNYDLSDKGHSAWTPSASQPGYGNFCFGHFSVTTVDSISPNQPDNPTEWTVNYHYEVQGIPSWANTPESRRAFPKIAADTSIQAASATVIKGTNNGWAVVPPQPAPPAQ